MAKDRVILDKNEKDFRVTVFLDDYVYTIHLGKLLFFLEFMMCSLISYHEQCKRLTVISGGGGEVVASFATCTHVKNKRCLWGCISPLGGIDTFFLKGLLFHMNHTSSFWVVAQFTSVRGQTWTFVMPSGETRHMVKI